MHPPSLPPDAEIAFEIHSPGATFSGATCRIRGLKLTQYLLSWTGGKGDEKPMVRSVKNGAILLIGT